MLGNRIKERRIYLGMTQKEVAEMSGITAAGLSMIEKGNRIPNVRTFYSISKTLLTTMDNLYDDKTSNPVDIFINKLEKDLKERYELCEDFSTTPSSILLAVLNAVSSARIFYEKNK